MSNPQPRDAYLSMRRFQTYFRDVIDPSVWSAKHAARPLAAAAHLISDIAADPITAEQALAREFRPVSPGWRWGPKWSTAWFRVSGAVPAEWKGLPVALRFSTDTEGQIWSVTFGSQRSGHRTPIQGLDVNRDAYHLTPSAAGGEAFEALIEAACNHPFGASSFEWDHAEMHHRWNSAEPGRFERCELAVFEPVCWELRQHYAFALKLLEDLPLDSNRAQELIASLRRATNHIDQNDLARTAEPALAVLRAAIATPASGSTTECFAVGHAHLDTAWLWPIRETKRKVLRTFSNQLRNMERFPSYIFLASQTQHYAWVEERAPELFEQIKARVAEGRWEPGGGMWIEPDVNCVSGESLARQMLHGERWWRSRFGDKARQRFLYLPDTFGFGSNLPQIMRLGGLDTFITNKLHWWQHTTFPHTTFVWRGIDGSWVLGHNTPGQDYNATNTPKELRKGESLHRNKSTRPTYEPHAPAWGLGSESQHVPTPNANPTLARGARSDSPIWLQPFGYGDGGGGATDWSIRFAEFSANSDSLPRVRFSTVNAFCDALHDQHARGADFPVWQGELDMEIHRGTLTSQAAVKRGNREAEEALRLAEILSVLSEPDAPARESSREPSLQNTRQTTRHILDDAWKLTLLNQFHDILPGSSIGWVYDDAKKDHAKIQTLLRPLIDRGLQSLAGRAPAVFNATSEAFSGVVETASGPAYVERCPPLGLAPVVRELPDDVAPVTIFGIPDTFFTVSTSLVSVTFHASSAPIIARGAILGLARLTLHEDRPIMWDAWDIDHYYPDKTVIGAPTGPARVVQASPFRAIVEQEMLLGDLRVTQRWTLSAGSARIDISHRVDWRRSHQLLRLSVMHPCPPGAVCTHAVHMGVQTRPMHANTAHERARFEFPAQGWVDISHDGVPLVAGAGFTLLAPTKFGFSCHYEGPHVEIGVSLLRAPTWPDPHADQGEHEFTVAILPHEGTWRDASVSHHAELLRSGVHVIESQSPAAATLDPQTPWAPWTLTTTGAARLQVSALKLAEDDNDLILRIYESHGAAGRCRIAWNIPVASVRRVDLLERDLPDTHEHPHSQPLSHQPGATEFIVKPFEIITLRISRP